MLSVRLLVSIQNDQDIRQPMLGTKIVSISPIVPVFDFFFSSQQAIPARQLTSNDLFTRFSYMAIVRLERSALSLCRPFLPTSCLPFCPSVLHRYLLLSTPPIIIPLPLSSKRIPLCHRSQRIIQLLSLIHSDRSILSRREVAQADQIMFLGR